MIKIDGCKGVSFNNEYYSDACTRINNYDTIIKYAKRHKKIKEFNKSRIITCKMYKSYYQSDQYNISDISKNRRIKLEANYNITRPIWMVAKGMRYSSLSF